MPLLLLLLLVVVAVVGAAGKRNGDDEVKQEEAKGVGWGWNMPHCSRMHWAVESQRGKSEGEGGERGEGAGS